MTHEQKQMVLVGVLAGRAGPLGWGYFRDAPLAGRAGVGSIVHDHSSWQGRSAAAALGSACGLAQLALIRRRPSGPSPLQDTTRFLPQWVPVARGRPPLIAVGHSIPGLHRRAGGERPSVFQNLLAHAAVDVECGPGDIAGLVTGQIGDHAGHLARLAQATQGNIGLQTGHGPRIVQ